MSKSEPRKHEKASSNPPESSQPSSFMKWGALMVVACAAGLAFTKRDFKVCCRYSHLQFSWDCPSGALHTTMHGWRHLYFKLFEIMISDCRSVLSNHFYLRKTSSWSSMAQWDWGHGGQSGESIHIRFGWCWQSAGSAVKVSSFNTRFCKHPKAIATSQSLKLYHHVFSDPATESILTLMLLPVRILYLHNFFWHFFIVMNSHWHDINWNKSIALNFSFSTLTTVRTTRSTNFFFAIFTILGHHHLIQTNRLHTIMSLLLLPRLSSSQALLFRARYLSSQSFKLTSNFISKFKEEVRPFVTFLNSKSRLLSSFILIQDQPHVSLDFESWFSGSAVWFQWSRRAGLSAHVFACQGRWQQRGLGRHCRARGERNVQHAEALDRGAQSGG